MPTRGDNGVVREAGVLLRGYRVSAGLSQQALAVALDVSLGIVSKWERGENVPTYLRAQQIDNYFHADGELLTAWGFVKPSTELAEVREQVRILTERVDRLTAQVDSLLEP